GTAPFNWTVSVGAPPTGLSLSGAGALTGTPTVAGQTTFTVQVTDAAGATATQQYINMTINPVPAIATTALPNWTVNRLFTTVNLSTGATGTAPFNWIVSVGAPPAGLSLNNGGALTGTPTVTGQTT